jgi:proton-translocating NADH-quinone oxidoreductase chain N
MGNWVWLIVLPLGTSPLVYLFGRLFHPAESSRKFSSPAKWAGLAVLLAAFIPFYYAYRDYAASGGQALTYQLGVVSLRLDGLSLLLAFSVLVLGTLVAFFSGQYLAGDDNQEKYYALLNAMIGAMIGLGCANDLFNLWIWFETMAVASYMLVAFYRDQPGSLEAGVKYLVQSSAGSALVLLGLALVFSQTGTLSLDLIRAKAQPGLPMLAAGALFVIGFGVKTALVPLHTWLPDAHSQAPSGISAMLSGVVIETGLVALLRSLGTLSSVTTQWGPLLLGFGALNMLAGNLLALRQTQVKRLLAFSSLSHVGYMLIGIGAAIAFNQANGAQGGLFHLLNHSLMKGLAFLAAGCLLFALYVAHGDHHPLMIADLGGAARRYPLVAFSFSIALLGLGGLPPLAGFMSKWQIFAAGFQTQQPLMIALVVFAALNSVLSLGYYAPLVNAMYRQEPTEVVKAGLPVPLSMRIPLVVLVVAIVVLGVYPSLANPLTVPAGASLLSIFGH